MNKVQERLLKIVESTTFDRALGFVLFHGANLREMKNAKDIAFWLEGAPKQVKADFLDYFGSRFDDTGLRVCTNCGRFMTEGYLLGCEYACSDTCAISLYDGDEAQLRKDIEESMEDSIDDYFWTEWEQSR